MKRLVSRTILLVLVLQALYLASPSIAHADEMTCTPIPVVIDVKPGDSLNKINPSAKGLLPVAVLSTGTFDASQFAPEMAHLSDANSGMGCEGAQAVRWNYEDVNGDGLVDLVFFFKVQDLNLTTSTTAVMLMAHGSYGSTTIHIMGTDAVVVKP